MPIFLKDEVDILKYLRKIRDNHSVPRSYTPTEDAMEKFVTYHETLRQTELNSDFG